MFVLFCFYYTCPRCDYGLVNTESIFLHDSLAHDDVSPLVTKGSEDNVRTNIHSHFDPPL